MPIVVPADLTPVRDELIERLLSGREVPVEADKLRDWFIHKIWWGTASEANPMGAESITCLDPSQFETLELSDDAVRGHLGLDDAEPITNEMRLEFATEALHSAYDGELASGFGSWCWPMVHIGKVDRPDGKSIVVGVLTRFQGPGSLHVPEWCEFFRGVEELIGHLKQSGYKIDTAPEDLDPQLLLAGWIYD